MKAVVLIVALLTGATAFAHTPVCRCELHGERVECEGRYHDASDAVGVTMKVMSYDGDVLVSGELDRRSRFSFTPPSGPFYILMDVGPGEMFEVDWNDIPGLNE